jgi:hypothetical protein
LSGAPQPNPEKKIQQFCCPPGCPQDGLSHAPK